MALVLYRSGDIIKWRSGAYHLQTDEQDPAILIRLDINTVKRM